MSRPPFPPFNAETARQKVRMAEDAWNSRDPVRVSLAYTEDSTWRNRSEFFVGREAIVEFLIRKWGKERDYRLIKDLWAFHENRIAVRFQYEWHDESGAWFRSYGNEQWEFDEAGLMKRREASINDMPIKSADRRFLWTAPGARPADVPGLGRRSVLTAKPKPDGDPRAKVLAQLGEVFRAHGYEGASLALITQATGARQGQPL